MDNKKGGYIIVDLPYIDIVSSEDEGDSYEIKPFDYDKAIAILNSNVLCYVYVDGYASGFTDKGAYTRGGNTYLTINTRWDTSSLFGDALYSAYIITINNTNKSATVTKVDVYY